MDKKHHEATVPAAATAATSASVVAPSRLTNQADVEQLLAQAHRDVHFAKLSSTGTSFLKQTFSIPAEVCPVGSFPQRTSHNAVIHVPKAPTVASMVRHVIEHLRWNLSSLHSCVVIDRPFHECAFLHGKETRLKVTSLKISNLTVFIVVKSEVSPITRLTQLFPNVSMIEVMMDASSKPNHVAVGQLRQFTQLTELSITSSIHTSRTGQCDMSDLPTLQRLTLSNANLVDWMTIGSNLLKSHSILEVKGGYLPDACVQYLTHETTKLHALQISVQNEMGCPAQSYDRICSGVTVTHLEWESQQPTCPLPSKPLIDFKQWNAKLRSDSLVTWSLYSTIEAHRLFNSMLAAAGGGGGDNEKKTVTVSDFPKMLRTILNVGICTPFWSTLSNLADLPSQLSGWTHFWRVLFQVNQCPLLENITIRLSDDVLNDDSYLEEFWFLLMEYVMSRRPARTSRLKVRISPFTQQKPTLLRGRPFYLSVLHSVQHSVKKRLLELYGITDMTEYSRRLRWFRTNTDDPTIASLLKPAGSVPAQHRISINKALSEFKDWEDMSLLQFDSEDARLVIRSPKSKCEVELSVHSASLGFYELSSPSPVSAAAAAATATDINNHE